MHAKIAGRRLELVQGDITRQQVDALVNAANRHLAGGGGVDGAIHRRGGPAIMAETRRRYPNGCPTGSAVISGAGELPARHVIHAVGPVWHGGGDGEAELLAGAFRRSLELARDHQCQSVALPALSTGAYGYPLADAAQVAIVAAVAHLAVESSPGVVRFVLFDAPAYQAFADALRAQCQGRGDAAIDEG
jgi:O-acetyl-ADP-ribose deacetylase (regulator of RNase III)